MIKDGDVVYLYLDKAIAENSKKKNKYYHLVDFWESINGNIGTIVKIDGEQVWVKGKNTGSVRIFTKETVRKI